MRQAVPPSEAVVDARGAGLLAGYCGESTLFFTSAKQTMRADSGASWLRSERIPNQESSASLVAELEALSKASEQRHVLAAAIPFDTSTAAAFWIFRDPLVAPGRVKPPAQAARHSVASHARNYSVELAPSLAEYGESVSEAVRRIGRGELEKVVLSRAMTLRFAQPVDRALLLRALANQNERGFVFALDVSTRGEERRTLLGASPELLLEKSGCQVRTKPLAGSRPRGRTPDEDRAFAAELLRSEKDLREHALVVDAVVAALQPFCSHITIPEGPSLSATPTMWHLATDIVGELFDPRCSSLTLALALHPTPAVCGHPRASALSAIRDLEGFDRGLFAGAIGYCDASGDGEWAVTLRCAEVAGNSVRLWAGAGIVAGSEAWAEVDETGAKLGTVLRALGLERAHGVAP